LPQLQFGVLASATATNGIGPTKQKMHCFITGVAITRMRILAIAAVALFAVQQRQRRH
jgi:hypothetical protein